jgi:hypothetical protein
MADRNKKVKPVRVKSFFIKQLCFGCGGAISTHFKPEGPINRGLT